jgi:DNA-3-methyladenine glycosylase I
MTLVRCPWGDSTPDYAAYHDDEWGVELHGESELYERLCLESFQSGLSWLTILRKRESFRRAFAGFEPVKVAEFGAEDFDRLMADASIVRNRLKIRAAITNAAAVQRLRAVGGLDEVIWSAAPAHHPPPATPADVPASTPASVALARTLKGHGFVWVGPTTMYAAMQACGVVDDHLRGCHRSAG